MIRLHPDNGVAYMQASLTSVSLLDGIWRGILRQPLVFATAERDGFCNALPYSV